jgi:hypothetical protein
MGKMAYALLPVFTLMATTAEGTTSLEGIRADFPDPPLCWKSRPLWFWNSPISDETTRDIMTGAKGAGYCGFGILPSKGCPEFMSAEYLDGYASALDIAENLGLKMCLYDEWWFPSGSAGGQLAKQYPEALAKRLDMSETDITGPQSFSHPLPKGTFMGAVAMNTVSLARVDISKSASEGKLVWEAPEGAWKVMVFTCVTDGSGGLVDYLNPDAVNKYVALTYQKYYDRFPRHFGSTIDRAFYDEPALYHVDGGRAWTEAYNVKFQSRCGYNPITYYPALWYDIGKDTEAARNALLGFRAELYANAFPKTLNDWCSAHQIQLTGHVDQEEIVNPVGLCGDLIKCFMYQDIPGIDEIFTYGRASKAYKVVSSAAYNYDKSLVMTECYGAMKDMSVAMLYKEAMDQFAKGINVMIPHAVWYDANHIVFEPELSQRTEPYASELPQYNQYIGRLQRVLQFGRHVADIGVLYPIATLQAGYRFDVGKPYEGGIIPKEADYMDVGELLALGVRRDFTFVHPEILDSRCTIEGPRIKLNNAKNHEEFRVFIIPGAKVIHASNLVVVKQLYDLGGKVIATTELPTKSAEFGKDAEVQEMVQQIFGTNPSDAGHENAAGGKAWFVKSPSPERLQAVLDNAIPVPDVKFEPNPSVTKGNLSYIHKLIDERHFVFVANSSETPVDTSVRIRGKLDSEVWDPRTGDIRKCESSHHTISGEDLTIVRLYLPPLHSLFIVSKEQ